MCGICGYLLKDSAAQARPEVVEAMGATIVHRGPDDWGVVADGPLAMGTRRLSIIDLMTGRQPLCNESGDIWICFNGECYNFQELRAELEGKGHKFRTKTDTESVLHAYEEWGLDFVNHLEGMYGFALWDGPRRQLVLVRDRFGIKPLYYADLPDQLVFGSEIKALLAHGQVPAEASLPGLDSYLTYEYVPSPDTIYKAVRRLPAAHVAICRDGRLELREYWKLSFRPDPEPLSPQEAAARLRELLKDSVLSQLVSDVPLGVFLSGGLDSTVMLGLMAELGVEHIKAFTITFAEPSFDESHFADAAAAMHPCERFHERLGAQQVSQLLQELAPIMDEPLGDASLIATYALAKLTRRHVTVALSGDGGDETFTGYPTYQAHLYMQAYQRLPAALRQGFIAPLVNRLPSSRANFSLDFKLKRFLAGDGLPPELRHAVWMGSFVGEAKVRLLSRDAAAELDGLDCLERVRAHYDRATGDLIDRMQYLDMKMYMHDDILMKVDRATMAVSLESRVPMLDSRIVQFVAGLPGNLRYNRREGKLILKQAAGDLMPAIVRRRGKKGFGIPVAEWLLGPLRPVAEELLSPPSVREHGLLNADGVQRLWQEHCSGARNHRKLLWTLLMFQLWYQHYGRAAAPVNWRPRQTASAVRC